MNTWSRQGSGIQLSLVRQVSQDAGNQRPSVSDVSETLRGVFPSDPVASFGPKVTVGGDFVQIRIGHRRGEKLGVELFRHRDVHI